MIDSITLHRAQVARANAAFAAHVPSLLSTLPNGCVCVKCERTRGYRLAHKGHRLIGDIQGIWCSDCSDWLWFQG